MSSNSYNFYPRLDGLQLIEADSITTGDLTASSLTGTTFKTNLVQSINPTNNLTLEALTTGQVIIKSNGVNIAVFDTANNLITFNSRVSQVRADGCVSYGPNCVLNTATGTTSTAFGNSALRNVGSTGFSNCAFGPGALFSLTNGDNCCAYGADALRLNVSNSGNTAVGLQALRNCVSSSNVAIGSSAGLGYTTSGGSVSIGVSSGVINTLYGGSSSGIVSVGQQANNGLIGASNCTAIGHLANQTENTASFSNSTCIGAGSLITASNQITLGRSSEFVCCPNSLVVNRTTNSTGLIKFLVNGDTQMDGSLEVRTGGQIRLFNNVASSQTNITHTGNYLVMNCVEATGKIDLRINGSSRLLIDEVNSLGKVLINNAGLNIFNNSLVFSKNTTATQTIEFINSTGTGMGNFFASELSNAFVFDFNNLVTINGFQVRSSGVDKLKITDTAANLYVPLDVSSDITTPTQPPGTNNTTCATTAFVQAAITAGGGLYATLAGANAFTGNTNTFNSFLPTSTINPTTNDQFTRKGFTDATYAGLATANAFTGNTNTFNSFLPTSTLNPTTNDQFTRKGYTDATYAGLSTANTFTNTNTFNGTTNVVDSNDGDSSSRAANTKFVTNAVEQVALSQTPYTYKYLFDECYDPSYNQCPFGLWDFQGTGSNSATVGSTLHPGLYNLQANRAGLSPTIHHGAFKEITFVLQTTVTTGNPGDSWCGLCVSYGVYTRSIMIKRVAGTTTFEARTNDVLKGTFTTVTYVSGNYFEFKIAIDGADIVYTIKDINANTTETITDTSGVFDINNSSKLFFQTANSASQTMNLDYVSVLYEAPLR